MKTGDLKLEKDKSEDNDITVIIKTGGKLKIPLIISLLPVFAMLAAIIPGILSKADGIETAKQGIIMMLLTGAAVLYISLNADSILNKRLAKTIITLGYLSSISLLLFVPAPETFSFWMIGGTVVAMLVDNKLGLLLHFNLSFLMGITMAISPEAVIQVLIIGLLISMLAGSLRQKSTVIYAAIIILSTNITIAFAINNFIFETKSNNNYLNSLFSIFAVLTAAFFFSLLYHRNGSRTAASLAPTAETSMKDQPESFINLVSKPEAAAFAEEWVAASSIVQDQRELLLKETDTADAVEDTRLSRGIRTSYEVLCDLDNELVRRMKQYSESLYDHSVRIGDLSCRAAMEIGVDEMLAMAGGLYHEVGKINGRNYIEEGLILAEEYAFPKELKAILKEHNIKYERPSSVEAVIVMLSDNVVSTIEYIEKNDGHRFSPNKIIDNIFQMRLDKGTFDASSLSLKDFKRLKEFYQKEFSK
jgi:putative nucleotidyltransferase with HDIG domain